MRAQVVRNWRATFNRLGGVRILDRRKWSRAEVEEVAISSIEIGERRREKLGAITNLAASIEHKGLIHPIVITEGNLLVVGRRRLAAAQQLGWRKIPARRFEKMSPEELRELELEENAKRLDLSPHEMSKLRMREIEEAEAETISVQIAQKKDPRGRKPGGDSEVARKLGTTREEIRRTREHIDAAERYPALQSKEWKRGEAIDAAATLDALDEPVREAVADMIQEPGIPKSTARKIIEGVASKPKKDQRQIAKLYRSDKPDDVSLAKTRAAQVPPSPPGRITQLHGVELSLEKLINEFPVTQKKDLRSAHALIKGVLKSARDEFASFRKKEIKNA